MNLTNKEIMSIIEEERKQEFLCAKRCLWIMERTWNPVRKIQCYREAKRFMGHVFGIDLVILQIRKTIEQ